LGKLRGFKPDQGRTAHGATALSLATPIVNNEGVEIGNLALILKGFEDLSRENALLCKRVEGLLVALASHGGVVLDGLVFSSKAQVKEVVMKEYPMGDAFEVFLDMMSLFCCDPSYSPATGWEKFTCSMEEKYSPTARKVVSSYYQTYGTWYAEGKPVVARKLLAAFKDVDKWSRSSGIDGRHHEIEVFATMSVDIAKIWVGDKLPADGKLAPLALKMIKKTIEWIHTVHKHLDYEYTRLTQQFIQDNDVLILLSEEVIIMYNRINAVRRQRMEFVVSKDTWQGAFGSLARSTR